MASRLALSGHSMPARLPVVGLLLSALAVAGGLSHPASADPPPDQRVEVQVNLGFSETLRIGHWTPVTVTLTNRGPDLVGRLEVQAAEGDTLGGGRYTTTHRRPVELPGDSRKRFRFTVFLESFSEPLEVRVMAGERLVARQSVDLRTRLTAARLLLVVGRDADLDYLNEPRDNSLRVLYPHPDLLPDRWQGYDGVAAMVLHGVSLERLDARQFEALREWLAHGGILAVSGGPDYTLLGTPRLAELLPGVPVGQAVIADGAVLDSRSFPPGGFDINRVVDFDGRVRLRAGDLPLVIERDWGRGRVLYLTFDVTREPFRRWIDMPRLWLELLRLPEREPLAARLVERRDRNPILALVALDERGFPHRVILTLFVALYLGVLFSASPPAPFRALQRAWPALVAWGRPVLFTVLAYAVFGRLLFPAGTSVFVASVIEPHGQGPYAELDVQVGWYAVQGDDLGLEFEGVDPAFRPLAPVSQPRPPPVDWLFADGPHHAVEPGFSRGYDLHMLEGSDVIAFDLRSRMTVEDGALTLAIRNRSGRALSDAWLLFQGRLFALGAIAEDADETRSLDPGGEGIDVGSEPWFETLRGRLGGAARQDSAGQRAYELLERRGQPAAAPDRALLLGLVRSPLRLTGPSAGWTRHDVTLVLQESPVALPERGGRGR